MLKAEKDYALEFLPQYYRIPVGNFIVLCVVIGNVMEVRRFIYARRNWQSWYL